MAIRSLRVKCEFLAMAFSVSALPSFGEGEGALPLNPEVYRFCFQEGSKKAAPVEDAAFLQTLCAAQVAPQRCPILRIGKALLL